MKKLVAWGGYQAEMTLDEIGLELGISRANVYETLRVALRKIRRRPESVKALAELVAERNRLRSLRGE